MVKQFEDFKSVKDFLDDYLVAVVPPGASAEQVLATKRAFISGAWAFVCLQDRIVLENPSVDISEQLVLRLRREAQRLVEEEFAAELTRVGGAKLRALISELAAASPDWGGPEKKKDE